MTTTKRWGNCCTSIVDAQLADPQPVLCHGVGPQGLSVARFGRGLMGELTRDHVQQHHTLMGPEPGNVFFGFG